MKKCLILLTTGFPYGTVEPFIESELPYHADFFDKILVFALDAPGGEARPLPPHVESYSVSPPNKRLSRLADVARAACGGVRLPDAEFPADKAAAGGSPKKRLFRRYANARAARHFNEILRLCGRGGFSGCDEIVIYSYWFFVTAMTGVLLREYLLKNNRKNVRLISRGHGYDIYPFANALNFLPDRNRLFASVDAVYVCSEHGANYLSENYPQWADKLRCAYLGTRDHGLGPVPDRRVFSVVSCSRVVPLKRLERLADALFLLRDSGVRLSWTHIGGGAGLPALKKRAERLSGFMDVSFEGELSNRAVLDLYGSRPFCLFVNVSASEGLPVSIMEAVSFGIPAVATDVGGTGEIVVCGVNGALIPADFENGALAGEIRRFAAMPPEQYTAFRVAARKNWEGNFCADENYRRFAAEISG